MPIDDWGYISTQSEWRIVCASNAWMRTLQAYAGMSGGEGKAKRLRGPGRPVHAVRRGDDGAEAADRHELGACRRPGNRVEGPCSARGLGRPTGTGGRGIDRASQTYGHEFRS